MEKQFFILGKGWIGNEARLYTVLTATAVLHS